MNTIAILQHDPDDPPGGIAAGLDVLGLPYRVVDMAAGEPVPSSPDDLAALILLGGEMHVHQEAAYPFLRAELDLLAACLRAGTPVLAICLGAQLLAAAAGARVYFRTVPERGWVDIDIVDEDSLLRGMVSPLRVLQWHRQSFELQPGATRIAARPDGEQVFRVGGRAWAVQFHPEVDTAVVDAWIADLEHTAELAPPQAAASGPRRGNG